MSRHIFKQKQILPVSPEEAWRFFSVPENLLLITPGKFRMRLVEGDDKINLHPGQRLVYRIKLFGPVRSKWVTIITEVKTGNYFIDIQESGPYRFWQHTHSFTPHKNGTEMEDVVEYELPFGLFGKMAHTLFVKNMLEKVFEYRKNKLKGIFNRTRIIQIKTDFH
jgi:ligand-binding SRPBCC domain-containing protein